MPKHEEKYCPRCSKLFECKVGSISLCHCSSISLSLEQRAYCAKNYSNCLCAICLRDVRSEYNIKQHTQKLKKILGNYLKEKK